jgi:peptide/nickel transport system ATP-binding protein
VRIGGRVIVEGVSFAVEPEKTVGIVGESGSGKTMTALAATGLLDAPGARVSGSSVLGGGDAPVELVGAPARVLRGVHGARIGFVFQDPGTSLNPLLTLERQITESLETHRRCTRREARARAFQLLEAVGLPDPATRLHAYPHQLSGGQRQRVMIAIALACDPELLIADEPTTALDVTIQAQILKLLRDMQERTGMAMLLITHDLGVVANVADEVAVMYHGQIMEAGPVQAIFRSPQHAYLKGLMQAVPHFGMKPGERLRPLREVAVDRSVLPAVPKAPAGKVPEVLLRVRELWKTYHTKKGGWGQARTAAPAVADVSFDIRAGECLGLVGESGCGKTTVSKMLMRAVAPDSGSVTYDDGEGPVDVLGAQGEALDRLRQRIQMVFQDPVSSLSPRMTVGGILSEPLEIHRRGDRDSRRGTVEGLLRAIGLPVDAVSRYPHSFSGGQRQRIGIARALALSPRLLVCDEPVSALDVSVQAQILNLLKDLQRDLGLTMLFISHNLAVVDYMADRVAVMWAGRIVEVAPRATIMTAPVHPYTKALLAAVPFADLDRPLDFVTAGTTSDEARNRWPAAFRVGEGEGASLAVLDLGGGHQVLARAGADARELAT